MEKMEMKSKDIIKANIKKLADIFPGCLVESIDKSGKISRKVDIEYLAQFLSDEIVESDEVYELKWLLLKHLGLIKIKVFNGILREICILKEIISKC